MKQYIIIWICLSGFFFQTLSGNEVLLVLGSDTGIWEGLNTNHYFCTLKTGLYSDPARNGYGVMAPSFRNRLLDFYGVPMKLTWWMMAGNMFRYATNCNVPIANSMPFYLMQRYHGDAIKQYGDEISLHYHTFYWSDYDQDGQWWWNQAQTFDESKEDFDFTLAQVLLDEGIFPVSFRSGWHYMDNSWQNYLEQILLYSMHNDYPSKRTSDPEPIDNIYDWSQAPHTFQPYHPSAENYQVPGNLKGWNLRSAHFNTVRSRNMMDTLFAQAAQGNRQMACFWGHLPETDFLANLEIMDSLAHQKSREFGNIPFRYCSAIEAMQRWRNITDTTSPELQLTAIPTGDIATIRVTTNEPLFQPLPWVAMKDRKSGYHWLKMTPVNEYTWESAPLTVAQIAKIAVAACDTAGNLTTRFLSWIGEDIFIDDDDPQFQGSVGNWITLSADYWERNARYATVGEDSAIATFQTTIPANGASAFYYQRPDLSLPVTEYCWSLSLNGLEQKHLVESYPDAKKWHYLTTVLAHEGDLLQLRLAAGGAEQNGRQIGADVIKISSYVCERHLALSNDLLMIGPLCQSDTVHYKLVLENRGILPLSVSGISSQNNQFTLDHPFPIEIDGAESTEISLSVNTAQTGIFTDTLIILSNDDLTPIQQIPCEIIVEPYFSIVDNADTENYQETGQWATSNSTAYGVSSRYAFLGQNPRASVEFHTQLRQSGTYRILYILPTTVNAATHAEYTLFINQTPVDTLIIDQNAGSGSWLMLGEWNLPANQPITLRIRDSGLSTGGLVLRADAIKFSSDLSVYMDETHPSSAQPFTVSFFPNPFSETLHAKIISNKSESLKIEIYNILGRIVYSKSCQISQSVVQEWSWTPDRLSNGLYFCRISNGKESCIRKICLIR